jgi:capsular exopolysaccharide synthesis family protein
LRGITDSLRYSEDRLQQFRSLQGVTNIDFQAQQTYQQMEGLQDQKAELMVKSKYYNYLREYLGKNNRVDNLIAPSSMDINDPLLNNLILELTRLYAERAEMSFNSVKNNPYLNSLEMKISDIKAKLIENIDNINKTGDISLREIDTRINAIETQINKLPRSQRELLVIERKFKLNDAIYTYLLTKRSEIQISKASNLPSNEMLDAASADDFVQVSPNTRMNYVIALLLGLFLPAALIYLKDFFRSSISGKQDIQSMTEVPIIGHIIHNAHHSKQVVFDFPTSLVAESFRSLRTNFQFFAQTDGRFTILITSMIKGEGKSFTSINLGTVFAQQNKKVVVVDFDLRKARLHHYLDINTNNGLSRYLSNNSGFDEIVFSCGVPSFDVIPSGPTPPNPSELISSEKTTDLFRELRSRYDIILIDSPPVGLVSDALQLIRYANVTLLVVRQQYTPKDLFASVISDLSKREIGSLNIVINDEKPGTDRYGYGYGYGYGQEKETLSARFLKMLKGKHRN